MKGLLRRLALGTALFGGLAGLTAGSGGCNSLGDKNGEMSVFNIGGGLVDTPFMFTVSGPKGKNELWVNNWDLTGPSARVVTKDAEGKVVEKYELKIEGEKPVSLEITTRVYDSQGKDNGRSREYVANLSEFMVHSKGLQSLPEKLNSENIDKIKTVALNPRFYPNLVIEDKETKNKYEIIMTEHVPMKRVIVKKYDSRGDLVSKSEEVIDESYPAYKWGDKQMFTGWEKDRYIIKSLPSTGCPVGTIRDGKFRI